MDNKQALEGFNKRDLWLYYAEIINKELNKIYRYESDSFNYDSTIYTLDNGDKLFLDQKTDLYEQLFGRKGDFGAEYYMLATDDISKGNDYYSKYEKKRHENKITLKAVERILHAKDGLVNFDDIDRLMDRSRHIYNYGVDKAAQNIKAEIDMNDVVVDDKYLLVCTYVHLGFNDVHIKGSIVEDGNVLSDLGEDDQGWECTIELDVINESILRPPSNSQELGGEEYEEAKSRFERNQ